MNQERSRFVSPFEQNVSSIYYKELKSLVYSRQKNSLKAKKNYISRFR